MSFTNKNSKRQQYGLIAVIAAIPSEITELTKAMAENNSQKKTLIGSSEISNLKNESSNVGKTRLAGTDVYTGCIGNQQIVLMQCGMGKVSAALGAQAIISKYNPDIIINTGCAGALSPNLGIGDVVVADETVEWDLDTIAIGNERGYISALGMIRITADKTLSKKIMNCIPEGVKVSHGLIVSGDQFVSTQEQRDTIFNCFPDALCAEMEGAAIGHVCAQNGIPFCILRTMSDTANHESTVDFATFSKTAGEASAAVLIRMLKSNFQN